jgi:hypothetical protein
MDWLNPKKRCRLLELPAELRDAIYEFALTSSKPTVTFQLDKYQKDSYAQAIQPALTRVSRQIRAESLPVYYACNDFILHTDPTKCIDARRWMECISAHILKLRRLEVWVRYVPLTNDRATSQGALGISMYRDVAKGCWRVGEGWKWITVVRKPGALGGDAKFLIQMLRRMLVNESTTYLSAEGLADLLVELRMEYAKKKMG